MLTKEILCAYAPFGVSVKLGNSLRDLTAVSLDSPFVFVTAYKGSREKQMAGIENIQLLLRPLSSLTKEREDVNYSTLIEEIVNNAEQHCDAYDEWLEIFIDDPNPSRIFQAPYEVVQELLKEKFDIFGLIESGHAIELKEVTVESKYTESKGE